MPSTAQQTTVSDKRYKCKALHQKNKQVYSRATTIYLRVKLKWILHLGILFERSLCKTRKRKQIAKSKVIHCYSKQLKQRVKKTQNVRGTMTKSRGSCSDVQYQSNH